jgi:predicted oxidoreductase
MILAGAGMVVGNLLGGYLTDRIGVSKASITLLFLMMLTLICVFFLSSNKAISLALTFLCGGLSMSLSPPVNIMMIKAAPNAEMMSAAFMQAAFNIANAAGAYLGGIPLTLGFSYSYPSLVGVGMTLTGLIICVAYVSKYNKLNLITIKNKSYGRKIKIHNTDLEVSRINFGGNVFGWTLDEKQSFEILDALVEKNFNFIDTADTYPWWVNGKGGLSEAIIGKWMKERNNRNQLVIATKVGSETKEHGFDVSKKHILKSVDESLQRLQTDHIDLYYTHFDDNTTPLEETLSAYDEIVKAGKVRYIAASNVSPERLIESFEVSEKNNFVKYVALQPHYNLVKDKIRNRIFTNCRKIWIKRFPVLGFGSRFSYWEIS